MAAAGRGTADFAAEGEVLDSKVIALLKRATAEALYDVSVVPSYKDEVPEAYPQLPSMLKPAFADRRYYAFVLSDELPEEVEVRFGRAKVRIACRRKSRTPWRRGAGAYISWL